MADSLRDQLLKSGIVKQVKDEKRQSQPAPKPHTNTTFAKGRPAPKPRPARDSGEIDLAKAYAIRAQTEAQERKRAEQEAAELARLKRERKAKVQKLLEGQALNKAEAQADQVRHFEYGGKIRRVYVDTIQLADLNAGKLGVVQNAGRYVLVTHQIAEQVRAVDPHLVALLVDPAKAGVDEDGIPDDLMW